MRRILGLALYGSTAASHRVRLAQYVDGLQKFGIQLEVRSLLDNDYLQRSFSGRSIPPRLILSQFASRIGSLSASKNYDGLIVQSELLPFFPGWFERKLLPVPYIYDFDDAFFLKYREGPYRKLAPLLGGKFDSIIRGAKVVTAGSRILSEYAIRLNPSSHFLPSAVDTTVYCPSSETASRKYFTIGWIGSPTTSQYLKQMAEPLIKLAKSIRFKFVVVGGQAPVMPGVFVSQHSWSEANEIPLLRSFDVGIMPLTDDPWSRGKCAYKLIQYMACSIPVVASPVGANLDVVTPECGFLAKDSDGWFNSLIELYRRPKLCFEMGRAGRERVVAGYSLENNLPRLRDHIHALLL